MLFFRRMNQRHNTGRRISYGVGPDTGKASYYRVPAPVAKWPEAFELADRLAMDMSTSGDASSPSKYLRPGNRSDLRIAITDAGKRAGYKLPSLW